MQIPLCEKRKNAGSGKRRHDIFSPTFRLFWINKNTSFESKRRPPPPTPSKNQRWAALSWRSYVLAKVFVTSYCRCAWIFRLQVFFSWILWSVLCYVVYVSMFTTSWIGIPVPKRFCTQYFVMTLSVAVHVFTMTYAFEMTACQCKCFPCVKYKLPTTLAGQR